MCKVGDGGRTCGALRDRQTDRQTDRDRETEKDRETDRDRVTQRERGMGSVRNTIVIQM